MNRKYHLESGQRFGRWVVAGFAWVKHQTYWHCICDCGSKGVVSTTSLRKGHSQSCGCRTAEVNAQRPKPSGPAHPMYKHGQSRRTGTYRSWASAKNRCTNPNNAAYKDYGGRGIRMHDSWANSFEQFLVDMGEKPKGTSLDRIDNNKGYEPGNCRWASKVEQANNCRSNVRVEWLGRNLSIRQWEAELGLVRGTLWQRLRAGWPLEKAMTSTVFANQFGPRKSNVDCADIVAAAIKKT